jgi:hypothetical protein
MPDWVTVANRLAPAEIKHRQQCLHRGVRVAVGVLKLGPVGRDIATLRAGRSTEHRHEIEQGAVPQWVMHNVEAGATCPLRKFHPT